MTDRKTGPKMYNELASWWSLLSSPSDYAEEAGIYLRLLRESTPEPVGSILELGSGGGNNASHMKGQCTLTLVDISDGMLEVSRALNPECEHIRGDMRTIRLDRLFDAVFVHDAIMYMTTEADLCSAAATAFVHCKPGGTALFVPDCLKETFRSQTSCGGHDGDGRAMRYLEWNWDPDPNDCTFVCDFAYMLREADGSIVMDHERHEMGLFSESDWKRILAAAGFEPATVSLDYSDVPPAKGFLCRKPAARIRL